MCYLGTIVIFINSSIKHQMIKKKINKALMATKRDYNFIYLSIINGSET